MRQITLLLAMLLTMSMASYSQNVRRDGKTFTQVTERKESKETKETPTEYKYVDSKGETYTVMLSSTGKAFIWKTSKKTGKAYRQYLPEIGKQINPGAYKEKELIKQ